MLSATKTGQLRNHSRFPSRLINIKQGRDGSIWALSRLSEIYLTLTWNGRSRGNEIQSVLDNRWTETYIRLKLLTKESINSKQSKDAPMKLNTLSGERASKPFYIPKKSIGNADWRVFYLVKTSSGAPWQQQTHCFFIISRRYNKKHRPQLARLFGAELTR